MKKNAIFTITLLIIAAIGNTTYAASISEQVHQVESTEYTASFDLPIAKIKEYTKEKLIRETLDKIPTYIMSTKTIDGNNYNEKVKFIAAAMVRITNEKYSFKYGDKEITATLNATVSYDTKEIERKVTQIEQDESRSKMLNDFMSTNLNIQAQIDDIKSLFNSSTSKNASLILERNKVIKNFGHSIINLPLKDMVAEFELNKKQQAAHEDLMWIELKNKEILSLNSQERAEFDMNNDIRNTVESIYLAQIGQPLKPKVIKVTDTEVTLQIVPNTSEERWLPWYLYDLNKTKELMDKYNQGQNFVFMNSGCKGKSYNDGAYEMMTKGYYYNLNGKKVMKDGAMFSRYSPYHQRSYDSPILGYPSIFTDKRFIYSQGGSSKWSVPSEKKRTGKPKIVWSIKFNLNDQEYEFPFITELSERPKRGWRPGMDPFTPSGKIADYYLDKYYRKNTYPQSKTYETFSPYRTRITGCSRLIDITYPKITIARSKASNLSEIKVEVFRN